MDELAEARREIAKRLRLAREQSGLSQGQVARLLGYHRPSVSEIEAGRRRVSAEELAVFAQTYDVSVSWLTSTNDEASQLDAAKLSFVAREAEKLQPDDLDRLLRLLATLRRGTASDGI